MRQDQPNRGSGGGRPPTPSVLWRRVDAPGHDTASLVATEAGAELTGSTVFGDGGEPTALRYTVRCDAAWRTRDALVQGWRAGRPVRLELRHDMAADSWMLNDEPCRGVAGCMDLDLGFTPATNLLSLRRLALAIGATAEVRAAWLNWPAGTLVPLVQRYTRRTEDRYGYVADLPDGDRYQGELRVAPSGFVLEYPGLWQAEVCY